MTVACLNLPLLALVLARHLEAGAYSGLSGVYAQLVFLGYYGLLLFVLVTVIFLVTISFRRLAVASTLGLLTLFEGYFLVNSVVYRNFRFHVDAFWIQYIFTSYSGLGVPPALFAAAAIALLGIGALEWGLFRLARRIRHRLAMTVLGPGVALIALALSQAIHVAAYYQNDGRITGLTPQLPFYYPLVSHRNAAKVGDWVPMVGESAPPAPGDAGEAFRYPLHPVHATLPAGKRPNILMLVLESWRFDMMNATVSPHMAALAEKSSVFLHHFSSGNSTPTGIFGLFYGIHPTYWTAVKANSVLIDNPVLIDVLQDHDYVCGIFARSEFERHKIQETIFRDIPIHEHFAGPAADARDQDMTAQLVAFMQQCKHRDQPFFGFAFYKSTHYSYYYPPAAARFHPAQKLLIGLVGRQRNPELFLNDYRNAIHYVDDLIGALLDELERSELLDQTIIIITSDHGEEFNDNQANYWGHGSNFTQFQTRVPLIFFRPGAAPRRVTAPTSHVDIPTTLLQHEFGCESVLDYSTGRDLFRPMALERPLVVGGYVNHAFIMGDDVYAVYPMALQSYKLADIKLPAGPIRPELAKQAFEEMHRFVR